MTDHEDVRKRKGHESFQTKLKIPLRPPSPFYHELKAYSRTLLYRRPPYTLRYHVISGKLIFCPGNSKIPFILSSFFPIRMVTC